MTAGGLPNLGARLTLDTSGLDAAVSKVRASVSRIGQTVTSAGKTAGGGFGTGFGDGAATGVRDASTKAEAAAKDGGSRTGRGFAGGFAGALTGGALAAGTAAIGQFVSGSVAAFAELEDTTAANKVLFGEAATAVEDFATRASASSGLSQTAAQQAAGTFGTFGKAAGLTGPALSGFSTQLAGLSGDLASFKGTSTEQAIEAVGAALRGEAEPIRAYGVLLDEATIAAEANALGLTKNAVDTTKLASAKAGLLRAQEKQNEVEKNSKATAGEQAQARAAVAAAEAKVQKAAQGTTSKLTAQQKVMATQSAILKQTKDAQGDFARTSDSTANTQKRLAAELENSQAALGQRLAPAVTAIKQAFIGLLTGGSGIIDFFKQNADIIGPLAGFIGVATAALAAHAIVTKVVATATKVWTAVQAAFNFVMAANPIVLVVIAIAALVAAIVIAYQRSETFR
ncbi:MAG: hypothetical protein ACRCZP_00485, partial [Phycicoccus sp.]